MSRRVMAGAVLVPALAAGAGVGVALTSPTPAGANGQGDPLYGDIDGDGWEDRAVLAVDPATSRCAVSVQLGLPGGGEFGVPKTYYYPAPGTGPWCPDMGVIVDLGGDGVSELVLAWFDGRPPDGVDSGPAGAGELRAGRRVHGHLPAQLDRHRRLQHRRARRRLGVHRPGRRLPEWLNTPVGELVPGPLQVPFAGLGPASSPTSTRTAPPTSPSRTPTGGTRRTPSSPCRASPSPSTTARSSTSSGPTSTTGRGTIVTDVNHDGHTDVRSVNNDTGVVRTFLGNGAGMFTLAK